MLKAPLLNITHHRVIRHPGYLGWMVWAIGTQVLLLNPLSTVLFTIMVSISRGQCGWKSYVKWLSNVARL